MQLSLFDCDIKTLEKAAVALTDADRRVLDLEAEIKETAQALRECELAAELKHLRDELKSAKIKRETAGAELSMLRR
jgi:hypothetical protein